MMTKFLIGAAGLAFAGAALAQTSAPAPQMTSPPRAERVDTRNEVVAKVREHFARLDTNRDGFLTQAEADAGHAAMKERFRDRLGERGGQPGARGRDAGAAFDRLDANKDGAISREEFANGREMRMERRVALKDGQRAAADAPRGDGRGMHMRHMGGGMMGGHMFAMADANKDGRVTLQEATDAAVRHFDMADANRDGRITPDERKQMRQQFIEKRRAPKAG